MMPVLTELPETKQEATIKIVPVKISEKPTRNNLNPVN